jgi:deoxyribose-phosphate aldolase
MNKMNTDLAHYLDNAVHRATATEADVKKVCEEVLKYGFNAAFVNPCWVSLAKNFLKDKGKVGTIVSFPIGQDTTESKILSCLDLIKKGADELDISANVGWLKEGRDDDYFGELLAVVKAVKKENAKKIVKFIIEACYLTAEEIKKAAHFVLQSGADFVKTTSGFGDNDAKIEFVEIIKSVVGDKINIKAAGGIKTADEVRQYLAAGACRIGTSKAVEIIQN